MSTENPFRPEQLKAINDDPSIQSLLYDLDLMPEQVISYIRVAREEERERCAKIAESMAIPGHNVQAPSCLEIANRIRTPLSQEINIGCSCTDESCYLSASVNVENGKLVVGGMNHGDPKQPLIIIYLSDSGMAALVDQWALRKRESR